MFSSFSTAFGACEHSPSPSPSTYLAALSIQQLTPLQEKGAVSGWCWAEFHPFKKEGTGATTGIKQRMLCKAKRQVSVLQRWFRQSQQALLMPGLGWAGGKCHNKGQIFAFQSFRHCWKRGQVQLVLGSGQNRWEVNLVSLCLYQDKAATPRSPGSWLSTGQHFCSCGVCYQPTYPASITRGFWQEALSISPSELKYFFHGSGRFQDGLPVQVAFFHGWLRVRSFGWGTHWSWQLSSFEFLHSVLFCTRVVLSLP